MKRNSKQMMTLALAVFFFGSTSFAGMVSTGSSGGGGSGSSNGDLSGGSTGSVVTAPSSSSGSGIQAPANDASNKQQTGTMISSAALGVGAAGMAATCNNPSTASACTYFMYGTAVSAIALVGMTLAQSKSKSSKNAVSSGGFAGNYEQDAMQMLAKDQNYQKYQAAKPKLDKLGYKIDEKKGTWYDPNKKKWLKPDDFKDSASMSRAGFSSAEQQGFNSTMAQMKKDVAAKTKNLGAEGSASGDDLVGGGSGGSAAGGSGAGGSSETGVGAPVAGGAGLGINRDPAQVAGMTKSYNGESIGVAGDSLFSMMNRRYNLHKDKGTFLENQ